MNWLSAVLKTFGPRVVGIVASGLAGLVFAKTKGAVTLDPTQVVEITTTMLGTYAAAHRATSSVINPGDNAKGRVADATKDASDFGTTIKVPKGE